MNKYECNLVIKRLKESKSQLESTFKTILDAVELNSPQHLDTVKQLKKDIIRLVYDEKVFPQEVTSEILESYLLLVQGSNRDIAIINKIQENKIKCYEC